MRRSILFLGFLLSACSSSKPAPEPEILPCYKSKNFAEYDRLSVQRFKNPGKPLMIKGKSYACVDLDIKIESECYKAKTKKEFNKLSKKQEKGKGKPFAVKGKNYSCLQKLE